MRNAWEMLVVVALCFLAALVVIFIITCHQVYASRDPNDNIFCPQIGWGADTDAYVWDGVNGRSAE